MMDALWATNINNSSILIKKCVIICVLYVLCNQSRLLYLFVLGSKM